MSCPTVTTILPTECIGNSLNTINSNYQSLRTGVCDNQDQINALRTLLYQLSSNMTNTTLDVPYARLVERSGEDTSISNLRTITNSNGADRDIVAQNLFPLAATTSLRDSRLLKFDATPGTYVDTIGMVKNADRTIQFPDTGTYEINIEGPNIVTQNWGGSGSADIQLLDDNGAVILNSIPYWFDRKQDLSKPVLNGRINITDTSTKYSIVFRFNRSSNFPICAAFPSSVAGECVLFNFDIYKLSI